MSKSCLCGSNGHFLAKDISFLLIHRHWAILTQSTTMGPGDDTTRTTFTAADERRSYSIFRLRRTFAEKSRLYIKRLDMY